MSFNDSVEMTMFLCLVCFLFMQKCKVSEIYAFLALYAEIQYGHQKWREIHFLGKKLPDESIPGD